jgi:hypothetical protein
LWRLSEPIKLPAPITEHGKPSPSPEAKKIIADIEGRTKVQIERLGGVAGTQNIDRILRLPGTTNLPNAKKRKVGRVPCPTELIQFYGVSYDLDEFPRATADDKQERKKSGGGTTGGTQADELDDLIQNGCGDREKSFE